MGVLYAKVDGNWVPILNSTGSPFLPLAGGQMNTGAKITWPTLDEIGPGALKLYGAAPFGGAVQLYQGTTKITQIQAFGDSRMITYAPANNLRFEAPGAISLWPGATADPATTMVGQFRGGSSPSLTLYTGASNESLRVVANAGNYGYIPFYPTNESARWGYVGFPNASHLYLKNEIASGSIFVESDFAIVLRCGGEVGRVVAGGFLVGKTAADGAGSIGSEMRPDGQVIATITDAGATNLFACHKGAADADGQRYGRFMRSAGVSQTLGAILQVGTTGINYNSASDYRLKDDQGSITEAVSRIKRLRPIRIHWKEDPPEREVDGFFAHEVAEVVPEAVHGEKDAVDENGDVDPQLLDNSRLVPLLVAAVQELTAEVEQLRAEVALLKGAA